MFFSNEKEMISRTLEIKKLLEKETDQFEKFHSLNPCGELSPEHHIPTITLSEDIVLNGDVFDTDLIRGTSRMSANQAIFEQELRYHIRRITSELLANNGEN